MCVAANTATTIDGTKKTVENSVIKRRKKIKKQTISGTVTLKTQIQATVTSSLTASKYLSWAGQWEKKLSQIYSSDYHRRKASTSWNWKSIVEQQETLCQYAPLGRCIETNTTMSFREHITYDWQHTMGMPGKYLHQHQKAKKLHTCQILPGWRTWTSNSGSVHTWKTGADHDQLQSNEKQTSRSSQRPNRWFEVWARPEKRMPQTVWHIRRFQTPCKTLHQEGCQAIHWSTKEMPNPHQEKTEVSAQENGNQPLWSALEMNLNRMWWLWTMAPHSGETKWTSGQEPNHPPTLRINLRHQVDATHKTIGHQAQAATWTDKGRLLKIKSQKETLQPTPQNPGQKENIQQTHQNSELPEHRHQQSGHQL